MFVAHLLTLVRKHHLDLDGAAEIAWVQQNPQANLPSKTSDVAALYHPLWTQLLQVLQKYAPVESSSKATQEMVALKTQLAKREQQLRAQGVEISPAKPSSAAASEDVPAGPTTTSVGAPRRTTAGSLRSPGDHRARRAEGQDQELVGALH